MGLGGGAEFLDCKAEDGRMVKTFTIYSDGLRVRSVKLTYTDGTTSATHGPQSGDIHEIRLEAGERITSVTLYTDDEYGDLARIRMQTSYGKLIDGGGYWNNYPQYSIDVGSGYLVGATGNARSDYVKALGLIFLIEVAKTTISKVVYDSPQANQISRTSLDTVTYDNRGSTSKLDWDFTNSLERTDSTSFTSGTTQTFTTNVSVEASIPEIAKVGESYQWQQGNTQTMGTVETHAAVLKWSLSGSLDPGSVYRCYSYCQLGQADVEYTADVKIDFQNGESLCYADSGILSNTQFAYAYAYGEDVTDSADSNSESDDEILEKETQKGKEIFTVPKTAPSLWRRFMVCGSV